MSKENQEIREKRKDFDAKVALEKLREYRDRIVEIHKSFANIDYCLYQYKEDTFAKKSTWRRILTTDFKYLESESSQFYINSIKDFSQLYYHLKLRYEEEVLIHRTSNI